MNVLALIPARGGSKGVYKKNIRKVDGKPLIAYAIEVAQQSKLINKTIVSTDCDEIIEVVKKYDCNFIKRSKANAEDNSPIDDVIFEVLNNLDEDFDVIMLLQPTSPIREVYDLDNVIKMMQEDTANCVVSVIELSDIHPARMYSVNQENELIPLQKNGERKRRQDLASVYIRNGCIYAVKVDVFKKSKKLIQEEKKAYIMPESKWLNIDEERDVLIADVLLKEWKKGKLK